MKGRRKTEQVMKQVKPQLSLEEKHDAINSYFDCATACSLGGEGN